MSKKSEKISEKEQDEQKSDSVYDFLYYDKQRVASFLAQFDDSGHLQQIKESKSASKGAKRGFKVGLGGGATFMGTGGQGNVNLERSPGEHGTESTERVYDPLWTNALEFLDSLAERNLIQRDVKKARIGQFVVAPGRLSVTDLPLLRKIWELPAMKAAMVTSFQAMVAAQLAQQLTGQAATGTPHGQPARQQPPMPSLQVQAALAPLAMEVLPLLPHFLQASIDGKGYSIWCGLSEQW